MLKFSLYVYMLVSLTVPYTNIQFFGTKKKLTGPIIWIPSSLKEFYYTFIAGYWFWGWIMNLLIFHPCLSSPILTSHLPFLPLISHSYLLSPILISHLPSLPLISHSYLSSPILTSHLPFLPLIFPPCLSSYDFRIHCNTYVCSFSQDGWHLSSR